MEAGRIIESGVHQALLVHNGVYAKLWALQQEEQQQLETARVTGSL